jgi:hypothetical protein
MTDKERITQPSLGSNEVGTEASDTNVETETELSTGTDTQLLLTAKGGKKHKKNKNINNGKKMVSNQNSEK